MCPRPTTETPITILHLYKLVWNSPKAGDELAGRPVMNMSSTPPHRHEQQQVHIVQYTAAEATRRLSRGSYRRRLRRPPWWCWSCQCCGENQQSWIIRLSTRVPPPSATKFHNSSQLEDANETTGIIGTYGPISTWWSHGSPHVVIAGDQKNCHLKPQSRLHIQDLDHFWTHRFVTVAWW